MPARIPDDQIEANFWSKVNKDGPVVRPELGACWLWTGGTNGRYGVVSIHRRRVYAHRFVCELTYGPLLRGQVARHHCDNPICVRPDHILPGTGKDNMADAKERGRLARTVCRNGHVYAEVGVYVDGPDSKYPGKRQCRACNRAWRDEPHRCAGVIQQRPGRRGTPCKRKIPTSQTYCHGHRPEALACKMEAECAREAAARKPRPRLEDIWPDDAYGTVAAF